MPNYRWTLSATCPKPSYPKSIKTLGDHLKVRRLNLGLTQKDAAARLAVDADSVRNWEAGRTTMEVRYYPPLIAFLGYDPVPRSKTLGEAVKGERMARGWSRKRLAREAGVDEATVRRLEHDTPRMAVRVGKAIRDTLNV